MKAVILAGGLGTRISEETDRVPKPMIAIGDKPVIWHIMKIYSHYGVSDFVICLGYKGYMVKEYFSNYFLHSSDVTVNLKTGELTVHQDNSEDWRVTLVDTGEATQTGGRIKRIRRYLDDEAFCLTYGDGVSDVDVGASIAFHKRHGRKATVTAISPPGRFGVLDIQDGQVKGFAEKVDNLDSRINAGFFVLEPSAVDYIAGDHTLWEREPMERLAADGELMAFQHAGFWQPMDTLRDKRALEDLWASGQAPWAVWRK